MDALRVTGLGRGFGRPGTAGYLRALESVDLTVAEGETVGLLGVNGAGKTTLTRIVATLLLPSEGQVLVYGSDVVRDTRAVRRDVVAIFGGDRGLYNRLTGRENLRFFVMLRGAGRRELPGLVAAGLAAFGLEHAADRRVGTYSRGMRQRLHLAIGMAVRPRLMLLDEPTVGLDPIEAERFRGSVSRLRDDGVAVLLTSHQLLDVERLADRVAVLDGGRVVRDAPTGELVREAGHVATVTVRGTGPQPRPERLPAEMAGQVVPANDGGGWTLVLRVPEWDEASFTRLGRVLGGATVVDVSVAPAGLEEVLRRLGKGERADA